MYKIIELLCDILSASFFLLPVRVGTCIYTLLYIHVYMYIGSSRKYDLVIDDCFVV